MGYHVALLSGLHPEFIVKLVFEIAVAQQMRTHDQTFEGSWTPTAHQCPRCSHAQIWSTFGPIMPNHLRMPKIQILGDLLTASDFLKIGHF